MSRLAGEVEELSLAALFRRGEAIVKQLQDEPPTSAADAQRLLKEGATCLERAAALTDSLALFSPNEEAGDLATPDLKFLLVTHLRAELLSLSHAREPVAREAALRAASRLHTAFLHSVQQYGLLSKAAQPGVVAALDAASAPLGGDGGGEVSSYDGGRPGAPLRLDPGSLRQLKVERFKLERSLRARLEAVEKLRGGGGGGGDGDAAAAAGAADGDVESQEREAWLLRIELAALKSSESLGSLAQERRILQHAATLPEEERSAQRSAAPPPALMAQLRAAVDGLAGGSAAGGASERSRLQAGVFKPRHLPPTLSVEQQGELEVKAMVERQREEAERAERAQRAKQEQRSDEEDDGGVVRQRAMDDWKDENPCGWGNSKLRPCG